MLLADSSGQMQWYGGLGIVVLSLALLFRPGMTAKRFAFTKASEEDRVGGTKAHARRVLVVYGLLTGAGIVLLVLAGARSFRSLALHNGSSVHGGLCPA
jgi:trk system potassium uptake protein